MTARTVTNQAELDAAIADHADLIYINSDAGVWLILTNQGSSRVVARDSSRVEARDSSRVEAWGSSRVVAWGSSRVEAWKYVAVHLYSQRVRHSGEGHVIDLTELDLSDVQQWCDFHGVKITRGSVLLFKAVNEALRSGRGFEYPLGQTVTDPNWSPGDFCGGGLHLSPSPSCAKSYMPEATRFLACRVKVTDLCPVTGGIAKAKARAVKVLHECDLHGDRLVAEAVAS